MTSSHSPAPVEFVRLERETPWGMEIGRYLLAAIPLLGIAGVLGTLGYFGPGMGWVELAMVAAFGSVGLLALLMVVHQSIARRVPETRVEVASLPVLTGVTVAVRVIQPGPVRLRSLRAKVVWLESDSESGRHIVLEENFLDAQNINVSDSWESVAELSIPENARPTGRSGGKKDEWRIEVWGRVRFFPDFLHPFVLRVKRPDE